MRELLLSSNRNSQQYKYAAITYMSHVHPVAAVSAALRARRPRSAGGADGSARAGCLPAGRQFFTVCEDAGCAHNSAGEGRTGPTLQAMIAACTSQGRVILLQVD